MVSAFKGKSGIFIDLHATGMLKGMNALDHMLASEGRSVNEDDLAQMQDILIRFRQRLRHALALYRHWQADADELAPIEVAYRPYEGLFIRRQLQDAWQMYMTVNKDYHTLRRYYLMSNHQVPHKVAA